MRKSEDGISKCPNCGAVITGKFCEYCGTHFASDDDAKVVIINNFYGSADNDSADQSAFNRGFAANSNAQTAFAYAATADACADVSRKSRLVALLLAVFLGYFGVHRFYAGQIATGIVYLFTFGLLGLGWVVDIIRIALGCYRDGQGLVIRNW